MLALEAEAAAPRPPAPLSRPGGPVKVPTEGRALVAPTLVAEEAGRGLGGGLGEDGVRVGVGVGAKVGVEEVGRAE